MRMHIDESRREIRPVEIDNAVGVERGLADGIDSTVGDTHARSERRATAPVQHPRVSERDGRGTRLSHVCRLAERSFGSFGGLNRV
ncbi:hypothetical protein GCM10009067_27490 [Haloarcula sebkhae]|uniref:Uncharacterized protein n=1 Tax=Haloarcula sebkhae TaxID=932660 RepID=A0A830F017_9EURY|nr:hypothetical protein GCM10009067_27490 [Haloarcula sebkhae]